MSELVRRRFELQPPLPYSLELTAHRFTQFPEAVNVFEQGHYRRLLFVAGKPLLVSVKQEGTPARALLRVELVGALAGRAASREAAIELLERTLGVGTAIDGFYRAFRRDPVLGPPIAAFRGLRSWGLPNLFEAVLTAILAQQVNLHFAYDIRRELCLAFGRRARIGGRTFLAFPTPKRVARESEETLRGFRLSGAKAGAIARVAQAFASRGLDEDTLRAAPDEEVVAQLTSLKGIGRWTAETALIRGLGRPDAFPAGDLGVIKYIARGLLGHDAVLPESEMRTFSERWRPHRSLALTYAYAELARRDTGGTA